MSGTVPLTLGPGTTGLVTGASSGIGAAIARSLAGLGCRLLVTGRDATALPAGLARTADLTAPAERDQLVTWALTERVDLLVCAAGRGWAGRYADMPAATLREVVELDLLAAAELVRALLPPMLERGRGHVVLVSSIAGFLGVRDEVAYSAAKAGLRGLADGLRLEVDSAGVGVTLVAPGAVRTPFFQRRGRAYDRAIPRPMEPDRVAAAVVRALERGQAEVFLPGWLRLPARLHCAAPGLIRGLERRFG